MAQPAEIPAAIRSRPKKRRAADAIFAYRHRKEPAISLQEYLRKAGR
jgi:hypothetical protein